jgi:SulP family sulfate permease
MTSSPRTQAVTEAEPASSSPHLACALRQSFAAGYQRRDLWADLAAGLVVGIVALPLSMALAIASGAPPQHGLYTAIVAGGLIALLGGSRVNVSGPTAAFVVLLAPVAQEFGLGGLMLASLMAGVMLVLMGMARLGRLIQFVPYPVTTGFTAGIAVVIATLQLKDFLGLSVPHVPEHYLERVAALASALPTMRWMDLALGAATLAALVLWPKINRKVPAPLVALSLAAVAAWAIPLAAPQFEVDTINQRFSYASGGQTLPGIPRSLPEFAWPWSQPGPDGQPIGVSLDLLRELSLPALAIAMLGAIESLLCSVVADGMTGFKHDPDSELVAQGIGNMAAPFFGGFAATAAIARTAANIRAGARSPLAAAVHAAFLLLSMLALAPLLGYLPMASLAALLMLVAWRMSDVRHFAHTLRAAPRGDVIVLVTCFALTVVFDMVVSVTAGVMLAALLFMQRMASLSSVQLTSGKHPQLVADLPSDVRLYEIAGPLFFGAAEQAAGELAKSAGQARAVILYMGAVPMIDITGLVALESAIAKLQAGGSLVVLAGVKGHLAQAIGKSRIPHLPQHVSIHPTLSSAEAFVRLAAYETTAPTRSVA